MQHCRYEISRCQSFASPGGAYIDSYRWRLFVRNTFASSKRHKRQALSSAKHNYSIISYWYLRYLKVMIKKWREKPHDSIELWNFVTRHPNNRSAYTLPSPLSASWRNLVKLVRWISNQWREVSVEENHCQPALAVQVSDLFLERILFHYALTALVTRH